MGSGGPRASRRLALLGGARGQTAALALAAVACAPFRPEGQPERRSGAPARIVLGVRSTPLQVDLIQRYVDGYRAVAPSVAAETVSLPSDLQAMRAALIAAVAAGTAPDLFNSDGPWLPEFATMGLLDKMPREAQRDLQANFTEGAQRYGTYRGAAYVYPFETLTHALYYNKQLFSQVGLDPARPPRTFADFREAARRLAKRDGGGQLVQPGFVGNNRLLYVGNFVYNAGGRILSEDDYGDLRKPYTLALGEAPAQAALQLHHDVYTTDRAADVAVAPGFQTGSVGMVVTLPSLLPVIAREAPALEFGVAPLPTQLPGAATHQMAGWSWGGSPSSKAKDAAWAFLIWMNSRENVLTQVAVLGSLSAHKAVLADPAVTASDPQRLPVFYQALKAATHVRPKAVTWSEIEAVAEPDVRAMFAGGLTPRSLVDKIAGPVATLLTKEP
jgi:ABC-type glycerol-3-phosphate transport system substrate-binding protein